jgi:hypothetical protein
MFYTIIGKSGWNTDFWRVNETCTNKQEAQKRARDLRQPEATQHNYKVVVKAHRKPLADLIDRSYGGNVVKFNDGTRAVNDN